jgi:hypothetical protein
LHARASAGEIDSIEENTMSATQITTYLNDHLAGSVSAIELLEHLIKVYAGRPLEAFFRDLHREIKADQDVLRELIGDAGQPESWFKKTMAWFLEKVTRSKFKLAGEDVGGLGLVQALEMLALGIRGKQLLWQALAVSNWPPAHRLDLPRLEQRAIEQQQRVEEKRVAAAREAFSVRG